VYKKPKETRRGAEIEPKHQIGVIESKRDEDWGPPLDKGTFEGADQRYREGRRRRRRRRRIVNDDTWGELDSRLSLSILLRRNAVMMVGRGHRRSKSKDVVQGALPRH
jgi:hypothetical protein